MAKALIKGWEVLTTVEKYDNREALEKGICDVQTIEGNVLLIEGVNAIWKRLAGAGDAPGPFDHNNSYIGVGNNPTGNPGDAGYDDAHQAERTETGLGHPTDYHYSGMMTDFPIIEDEKMTFKAEFTEEDANFTWHEWTVANGGSNDATNLNLKYEPMGTKFLGAIWRITVEIRLT